MATHNIKRGNGKITLSINETILKKYKQYCDTEGIIISRQIEKFMKEQLKGER